MTALKVSAGHLEEREDEGVVGPGKVKKVSMSLWITVLVALLAYVVGFAARGLGFRDELGHQNLTGRNLRPGPCPDAVP